MRQLCAAPEPYRPAYSRLVALASSISTLHEQAPPYARPRSRSTEIRPGPATLEQPAFGPADFRFHSIVSSETASARAWVPWKPGPFKASLELAGARGLWIRV